MRRLGTHDLGLTSSSPAICIVVYDSTSNVPSICFTQEANADLPYVIVNGVVVDCTNVLDDVTIKSARPTTAGGLKRNTLDITFRTDHLNAYPFMKGVFSKEIYYAGKNYESVYFVAYSFDRSSQAEDITHGACYGAFQIRDELAWSEDTGIMSISLIDIITGQEQIVGATSEAIEDIFYIYNSWYQGSIFPKVYGQVPRIKLLNAFPTFNLKKLSGSITGTLRTAYGTGSLVGTILTLENNVTAGSLLLQLVSVGGTVRIKFKNGEVMSGALAYNTGADTIEFTVAGRNTYYNQVKGWTDSKDGRTPPQWGAHPNYTDVDFAVNATIIPDAKHVVLDPEGWMQADIHFYDTGGTLGDRVVTNSKTRMKGLLEERKDSVLHDYWNDTAHSGLVTHSTLSCYFDNSVGNETYLSPAITPVWAFDSYRFMNFFKVGQNVRLFFIDPATANAAGSVGDTWNLVGITPGTVDYSCYIRNGFSKFDSNNIYCEAEGRLIQIPPANVVSVTQTGTYHGLTNLTKITLTTDPLGMDIGATSNTVYADALYQDTNATDGWLPSILSAIITQECAGGLASLLSTQITDASKYPSVNIWPYIGVHLYSNEKVTDVIDKICYQCGVSARWDAGKFDFPITSFYKDNYKLITLSSPTRKYVKPMFYWTDKDEMLEKSAALTIGRIKTVLSDGLEHIQIYFKGTYGGWDDPFYSPVRSEINRAIKPKARVVEYHFDYINDADSFAQAAAMALAIGSASAYSSTQRKITTEMTMKGCRWEALDPIIFRDYPLLSSGADTNVSFDTTDDRIMYNKPITAGGGADLISPNFLMGCVGCVDDVTYKFSVLAPTVTLTARMSQLNVDDVTGIVPYKAPGAPNKPTVNNNPNLPPNQGAGNHSFGYGGNSIMMPEVLSKAADVVINSTSLYTTSLTLTCDAGWIFDLGWDWTVEVVDPKNTNGVAISSTPYGTFANKNNDAYVPTVYTINLNVYYFWFDGESLNTQYRECKLKFTRRMHLTRDPSSEVVEDFFYATFQISRVLPIGTVGS
jgi:hypothetical protein